MNRLLAWLVAGLMLAGLAFQALFSTVDLPVAHMDGAFQTASSLFRMDAGQFAGRDFLPYLGIGPLVLIFPVFKLAGGSLAASVFAAQFVTLLMGWWATSVLAHLVFRSRSLLLSLAMGAACFVGLSWVGNAAGLNDVVRFAMEPGNSLKSLRAGIPYLLAIALYLLIRHVGAGLWRDTVAGMLTGAVLLWSNDFAMPTAFLCGLFYAVYLFGVEKAGWRSRLLVFALCVPASWLALLALATAGHPAALLKYNFLDVARDQWWYFGPYSEPYRVFEFTQLLKVFSRREIYPLFLLAACLVLAARRRRLQDILLCMIGLTLLAGGVLPSIGGQVVGYFGGLHYWALATTLLWGLRGAQWLVMSLSGSARWLSPGRMQRAALVLLVLGGALFVHDQRAAYQRYEVHASQDPERFYVAELGGYLKLEWQEYIDYARQHTDQRVTEEYWGLWSAMNRKFPPWPVDSSIHALGAVREQARSQAHEADIVITTRYSYSPHWQPWGFSQNFWFYEPLLAGWQVVLASPTTVVWSKAGRPWPATPVSCRITDDARGIQIEGGAPGLYAVSLRYKVEGAGRYLTLFRNNLSWVADADGHVSVSPLDSAVTIPVLITPQTGSTFSSRVVGNPNTRFTVQSCTARKVGHEHPEVFRLQ